MTVSCEGFNGVDDEWVVDGSCSLQYELDRTYVDEYEYSEENGKLGIQHCSIAYFANFNLHRA